METALRNILLALFMTLLPATPAMAGRCREYVTLCGIDEIMEKKGLSQAEVESYRIKLWSARSRVIATVLPGTEARLLRRARGHYKIKVPEGQGGAKGWVDGRQVKGTLWLDTKTLEQCTP